MYEKPPLVGFLAVPGELTGAGGGLKAAFEGKASLEVPFKRGGLALPADENCEMDCDFSIVGRPTNSSVW